MKVLERFSDPPVPTASLTAWFHALIRNQAVDLFRKRKRRDIREKDFDVSEPIDRSADPADLFDRGLDRELGRTLFQRLQTEVSEKNFHIFRAHWIEEKPVAEIASELGLAAHEVSNRIHRMKKKMSAWAAAFRGEYCTQP